LVRGRSVAEITFTHPDIDLPPLRVDVKPDSIYWNYGLNTANFPTHGGEVVQILSVYFDDLEITGTIRGYPELEKIYRWFLRYMHLATQGDSGHGSFNTEPVIMHYPERRWTFRLYPKALPGFKYGREVVAPTWKMIAAVDEPEAHANGSLSSLIVDQTEKSFLQGEGVELFGKATAQIGFNPDDPFSGPTTGQVKKGEVRDAYGRLGDFYNKLIPAYLGGDFRDLAADFSKPSFLKGGKKFGANDPATPDQGVTQAKKIADRKKKPQT
jgi:hypothetical protein